MNDELMPVALAWLLLAATMAVGIYLGRRMAASRDREPAPPPSAFSFDFFQQIRDAALVTENGIIVEANPAAHTQFGYRSLIGVPVVNLLANEADEMPFVRALLAGPVTDYELRARAADGTIVECLITATGRFDARGKLIGCRGFARDVTERNRIVAELRRAEQDHRGLFEHAHDAILIIDPRTERVIDANDQACILYGFPRQDFVGRSMVELSVDPQRGKALLRRTREGSGKYETFESRQFRRDGSIIEVEISAAEVMYQRRMVILSINRDVTARRKAEKAIRAKEERLRLMLESVTDYAIVMLDPIGRIVSWNEGAQRINGYAEHEVIGQSVEIFFPGNHQHRLTELLAAAATTGRMEQVMQRVRKDGSRFTAAVTLTRIVDDAGSLRGYAEITHDITVTEELERTQQEMLGVLRNVAAEWTHTFDAVNVPIVMLDGNGAIRRLNGAARALTGQAWESMLQCDAAPLPGEPWQTIAATGREALRDGEMRTARAISGTSVWEVSASATTAAPGDPRAIVVAYDLTLVTQLEASVRRHEVAAMLGSLVAGVAHEVRNPLFTISATLDAWEARYGASEGMERYAGVLREQVDRLNRLMHDLLEIGKPNPLVLRETALARVIAIAAADCASVAEQAGVEIALAVDDLPPVTIDAARMEQVFQNAIDNAVRHSPRGGVVTVEAREAGGWIECRVVDEGPGVGDGDPEKLFEPFFTRRRGGTGLGLAIARKVMSAHEGEITMQNRGDGANGAVATIRLPRRPTRTRMAADAFASDELSV